ncbi:MAG: hypothetical protein HYZ48_02365 [Chlamydiales bacterium]|nr:hypothetical protein [Chlamydiales bacterium]
MKSERLKKFESELQDLEQWLRLGLVPKKDLEKHKEEMRLLQDRIGEEKQRLRFLKESGEVEEFSIPKRSAHGRQVVEPHSMPDLDVGEENLTDAGFDMETESFDIETTASGEDAGEEEGEEGTKADEEEEEDPFSDKNRWRRGVLEDPDANDW